MTSTVGSASDTQLQTNVEVVITPQGVQTESNQELVTSSSTSETESAVRTASSDGVEDAEETGASIIAEDLAAMIAAIKGNQADGTTAVQAVAAESLRNDASRTNEDNHYNELQINPLNRRLSTESAPDVDATDSWHTTNPGFSANINVPEAGSLTPAKDAASVERLLQA